LEDIKKEYDAERQVFNDKREGEFDNDSDDEENMRKAKKSQSSSSSSGSGKVDAKSTNMIDQAILAGRKKKTKDMSAEDKQVIVTNLLEKMEDAWRRDMHALGSDPPRPAVHKISFMDKVR
jgi:hypothetical protein